MNFTKNQINNFLSYETIRSSGLHNMMSPQARLATCLDRDEYLFCLENYNLLKEASEAAAADKMLLQQVDHS
jgi:hypothetical protein